jgi:hypothetical protein
MAQPINNSQKALLHLAVAQLGMDDGEKRDMLRDVAGVESSKDLTLPKFQAVMTELERRGFKKRPGTHERNGYLKALVKWKTQAGSRPRMATPQQLARIETDWDGMRWYWARDGFGNYQLSLRGFLRSQAGVADLRFLTFSAAHKIIDAIKAIDKRGPGARSEGLRAEG